ncbi:MAG: hypothetical protein ISS23_00725 [Nanoarchaeota archaeon]|nr:hypothetical protein [Nanoarchaeota archaeon]
MKFKWINILLVLLFLLLVYLILTRIFGHSATDLIINITLFTFLGGLIYFLNNNIMHYIIKLNREFGEFNIKTTNGFDNIKKDMVKLNKKFDGFKTNTFNAFEKTREDIEKIKIGTEKIRVDMKEIKNKIKKK